MSASIQIHQMMMPTSTVDQEEDRSVEQLLAELNALRAELAALKAGEFQRQQLDALLDEASEGIFISDQQGNYVAVNSRACEMLGYDRAELLQLNVRDLAPDEDLEAAPLQFDELLAGKTLRREHRLRHKNGAFLTVEISAKMLADGRLQAIVRDISERKAVEQREKLAYELGRQLTTLLDPDALLAETVNRLKETFGYYHAHVYLFHETAGSDDDDPEAKMAVLIVQEGTGEAGQEMKRQQRTIPLDARRSLVAQAARQLKPVIANDVRQHPDHLYNPFLPDTRSEAAFPLFLGQRLIGVLDVQDTAVNHFDPAEVRSLQIVASQLSVALSNAQLFAENARLQNELSRYAGELEWRVYERTMALAKANQKLQELDQLKSEFLSHVSHELRAPLVSIKGFASSLVQEDVEWAPDTIREFAQIIDQESNHLSNLVDDLLEMTRIEAGLIKIEPEPCDLAGLVKSIQFRLKEFAGEQRIRIDIPAGYPPLLADKKQLAAVLANLLENALKYSPPDSPVRLAARVQGEQTVIKVTDQGYGIPTAALDQIFERFHRLDRDIERTKPGTGLGLSICRAYVEAHGGSIWAESPATERVEPDDDGNPAEAPPAGDRPGTTFVITLPLEVNRGRTLDSDS